MKVKSPILTIQGPIKGISPEKKITDNFTIRELYLDFDDSYTKDGNTVDKTSTPKFQFSGRDLPALNQLQTGDMVHFSFKAVGRKFEKDGKKGHITSLEAWNVKKLINLVENRYEVVPDAEIAGEDGDDLPF